MSRMVGTISRGIRAPIIRSGDDLVEIVTASVLEAARQDSFSVRDRDIVAMTEAIVARAQGNYASVEDIPQGGCCCRNGFLSYHIRQPLSRTFFKFFRTFSVLSLVCIVVCAALLAGLYCITSSFLCQELFSTFSKFFCPCAGLLWYNILSSRTALT